MSKSSNHALEVEQEWLSQPKFQTFIDTFKSMRWDYNMQDDYGVWKSNSDKLDWMNRTAANDEEFNRLYEYLLAERQERLDRNRRS